jgi:Transposase DDE domain
MDDSVLAIYCLCDDLLKALPHQQDPQPLMSDAEVMTTAIVAALYFGGNFERARLLLQSPRYVPHLLSKSQFNRRLHALRALLLLAFRVLGEAFKQLNAASLYIIDSFPVAACDNIRIHRDKRFGNEKFRGYTASKRRYFYGVKIFLLTAAKGEPVEMFLVPGATADVVALDVFDFDLPRASTVYGGSAFTLYEVGDLLQERCEIDLSPMRKKNSKRPASASLAYLQAVGRKQVETAGSMIERLLPRSIHAVTANGFTLKVFLFVLAYSFSCAL